MKDIKDFKGYKIKEDGTVWSFKGSSPAKLKPRVSSKGYLQIGLVNAKGKQITVLVHRLVAIAYIPNPHNLPFVCHKDDNKLNPHKDNLFWGSVLDNNQDCVSKNRQRGRKCDVFTPEGDYLVFNRIKEAAESLGLRAAGIRNALSTQDGHYKGYLFGYLD